MVRMHSDLSLPPVARAKSGLFNSTRCLRWYRCSSHQSCCSAITPRMKCLRCYRASRFRSPRWVAQFHGDESPAFCAGFGRAWLKAVPMGGLTDAALTPFLRSFSDIGCAGFVFDSHGGATTGGSGRAFDWSRIPRDQSAPVILAGGLTPDTVGDAVRRVRPFAVDVSSGIESAPAIKDHAKMCRFADEVFRARTD